jgi:hypothetical protein
MRLPLMRITIVFSCLLATNAWAEVRNLDTVVETLRIDLKGDTVVNYPRVTAATPALTAELNAQIASSAGVRGALRDLATSSGGRMYETNCEIELATDAFVSWHCSLVGDNGPMTGGSFRRSWTGNYYIDKGTLRPATLDNIVGTKPDRDKKLEALTSECQIHIATDVWVASWEGLVFHAPDSGRTCTLAWEVLAPFLVADNPSKRISADDPQIKRPPRTAEWTTAAPRFVTMGEPDTIVDTVTTLVWATHDNGTDLTWQAATAYADAYRGGGHADWRLPSEEELEMLADTDAAHRDKTDCTKGKNDLVITKLIHLSCGLAWSSTPFDPNRAIAFGFISGTARIAKTTEKKNYRALVVRGKARALN